MNIPDLNCFLIFGGIFSLLFIVTELSYLKLRLSAELTRKFLHFSTGTICAVWGYHFSDHFSVLILALFFYAVLGFSKWFDFLNCIHNVQRKSYGGLIFPFSIWLIFFLNEFNRSPYFYFETSVLILSISDPLATVGGIIIPQNKFKNRNLNSLLLAESKTKAGSLLFLFSSTIIVFIEVFYHLNPPWSVMILYIITIAVSATVTEAFSKKGFDNLFVPFVTWLIFIVVEKIF